MRATHDDLHHRRPRLHPKQAATAPLLLRLLVLLADGASASTMSHEGVFNVGLVTVPQSSVVVVERFGRYKTTLGPGFHLRPPWPIECMKMFEMRERPYNVKRVPAITADNVDMYLDAVVYLRIVDPYKAVRGHAHRQASLQSNPHTNLISISALLTRISHARSRVCVLMYLCICIRMFACVSVCDSATASTTPSRRC